MKYSVSLSKIARSKLANILQGIKETYNDINLIQKHQSEVINAAYSLDIFPERGPIVQNAYSGTILRKLITTHYILLYQINDDCVQIVDILVQKQNQ